MRTAPGFGHSRRVNSQFGGDGRFTSASVSFSNRAQDNCPIWQHIHRLVNGGIDVRLAGQFVEIRRDLAVSGKSDRRGTHPNT